MNRRDFIVQSGIVACVSGQSRALTCLSSLSSPSDPEEDPSVNLAPSGQFKSWISPESSADIAKALGSTEQIALEVTSLPWKGDQQDIGIEWAEFRWISKVVVHFAGPVPASIGPYFLEYWSGISAYQGNWLDVEEQSNPADPYAKIGTRLQVGPSTWTFILRYARQTCKIRLRIQDKQQIAIREFSVYGPSKWKSEEILIEWNGLRDNTNSDATLEVYNGEIAGLVASGAARLTGPRSWSLGAASNQSQSIQAKIRYTDSVTVDRTVLTVRNDAGSFSFLAQEAIEGSPIDLPDFGVFIKKASAAVDKKSYRQQNSGKSRIIEAVASRPEQTLENAYRNIQGRRVTLSFVGVDCNNHKFGIAPNGSAVIGARDPSRGIEIRANFALYFTHTEAATGDQHPPSPIKGSFTAATEKSQQLEEGWLPIIITRWGPDDLTYERTDYAVLPGVPPPFAEDKLSGTELAVMISRLRIYNKSSQAKIARYYIQPYKPLKGGLRPGQFDFGPDLSNEPNAWTAILEQNSLIVLEGDNRFVCCELDTDGQGQLGFDSEHGAAMWTITVEPGEERTLHAVFPGQPLREDATGPLKGLAYDTLHASVVSYWKHRLASGTEIAVPDQHLQNIYNASIHHFLLAFTKDSKRDEYYPNTSVFDYSCIGSESSPIMQALDQRGMKTLAAKCLRAWLSTQGNSATEGEFQSKAGGFYYFWPYYTINQGPILWTLAEHYLYTRDKAWLAEVAPHIIDGCNFIIRERHQHMTKWVNNKDAPQYGLAPVGLVCDMQDWQYSFMLNAYFYLGLKKCALVLADVDPDNSNRIAAEAEDYRKCIRKSFTECMTISPVSRLRDNTSVPSCPSYVGIRGYRYDVRDVPVLGYGAGVVMDVICGAFHLLKAEILEPGDREVDWMLNCYEDRFFMESPVESPINLDALSTDWFNLGGFEKLQPYYLHYPEAYLQRDQIPNFLRAFYNTLASISDPHTLTFRESLIFASGSEPNKTHEESWFLQQLRSMLVIELKEDLFLARGTPREWLQHGKEIAIKNAPTYFGETSYRIRSFVNDGRIEATITPPKRNPPANTFLRFRHPEGTHMRRVALNGHAWTHFDAEKDLIRLPVESDEITVIAYYA